MPILIKKIEGSIISYFGDEDSDYSGGVRLIRAVIGEFGIEDYISISHFEAFVQNIPLNSVLESCSSPITTIGVNGCNSFIELNISK